MRVFLDADVLFSAAKSDGAVRALLRLLLEQAHECFVDEYVLAEARRNLRSKGPEAIASLEALAPLLHVETGVADVSGRSVTWLPEKDRPVLAAAMRSGCNALVTGDRRHFGSGFGRTFGGVTVYSPRLLAERLLAGP